MVAWQIWCIVGVFLVILEMFTPALFFLNLAFAAFVVAIIAYFNIAFIFQSIVFVVVSCVFIAFLRPLLVTKIRPKTMETGMNAKYIGQKATVVKEVTQNSGRIAIYGEEWDARITDGETVQVGEIVKIKSYDSIIMYVEKIKE